MNIPEGWTLVPIEPTDSMLYANFINEPVRKGVAIKSYFRDLWAGMIGAAPQPPESVNAIGGDENGRSVNAESCGPSGHPPPGSEAGTEGNGGTPTRGTRETSQEQHDRIRANMLAAEAWCEGTTPNEKRLRRLLAVRVGLTYGDDGELQSSEPFPPIDFKRDTVEEIEEALVERGLRSLKGHATFTNQEPKA